MGIVRRSLKLKSSGLAGEFVFSTDWPSAARLRIPAIKKAMPPSRKAERPILRYSRIMISLLDTWARWYYVTLRLKGDSEEKEGRYRVLCPSLRNPNVPLEIIILVMIFNP